MQVHTAQEVRNTVQAAHMPEYTVVRAAHNKPEDGAHNKSAQDLEPGHNNDR